MSKLQKLILLLVLIGLSIIISTAILALHFIVGRRRTALNQLIIDKVKKGQFSTSASFVKVKHQNSKQQSQDDKASDSSSDSSSSTSSRRKTAIPQTLQHTVKDTHVLNPNDLKLHQQRMAPDTNSPILLGESHLGLALRDIPYEIHDTQKYYSPVELGTSPGSGSSGNIADENGGTGGGSTSSGSSTSGISSSFSARFGGNAIPPELRYGAVVPHEELDHVNKQFNQNFNTKEDEQQQQDDSVNAPIVSGGLKRRGVEFVKLENPIKSYEGSGKIRKIASSLKNQHQQKSNKKQTLSSSSNMITNFFSYMLSYPSTIFTSTSTSSRRRKTLSPSSANVNVTSSSSASGSSNAIAHKYAKEHSVLYHLQKASEYGNHYAQNMIANSLASGILPINNHPSLRDHLNITLNVTSDFSGSISTSSKSPSVDARSNQLSKAILLWHMSAMEGNIESLMALGYRHYISATSRSNSLQSILVHDDDLKLIEESGKKKKKQNFFDPFANIDNAAERKKKQTPVRHSPQESHHYGVLGTCESSLAYYEEAVNHIMDELESGPLRGKVTPAIDTHILPEIRQRGSSSSLSSNNKPDELDEALKFLEMRALHRDDRDTHAAYKLGSMYHYGLRGVKQDLRLALKYYEIGAEKNSWESAGQAGKFYLFGMGLEDDERDLLKAHRFFSVGMPGGISSCEDRFLRKQQNIHKDKNDDDDYDGDDDEYEEEYGNLWEKKIYQCDHPAVNGMGLLYVFGIPGKVEPNLKTAVRHFELAMKMGNMDAIYNLGMLRLGWMNPYYDDLFQYSGGGTRTTYHSLNGKRGPSTSGFLEATALFTKSAEMGHLQAKHRLGMIYSKGFQIDNTVTVRPECKKALSIFKGIATSVGTTVTKRMRAAYKQYMAGDYESSLRNYLAAAETGSIEAQVNAAFLLEEGYCLGMDHLQCMKASVRLWRAAAKMGHEEAYLRVGDFYYYGRLREDINENDRKSIVAQRDIEFGLSPLPWIRYVLYPEDLFTKARKGTVSLIRWILEQRSATISQTCTLKEGTEVEGTCINRDLHTTSNYKNEILSDEQKDHFKIAAKYYRTAAVELQSARANFNLGFMHEWGLGLSQDFYLAKRYYDLAAEQAQSTGDGAVANQIALFCMNVHEFLLKQRSAFEEWMNESEEDPSSSNEPTTDDTIQSSDDIRSLPSTKFEVILYHILTWETAVIILFTLALDRLVKHRINRNLPRRR